MVETCDSLAMKFMGVMCIIALEKKTGMLIHTLECCHIFNQVKFLIVGQLELLIVYDIINLDVFKNICCVLLSATTSLKMPIVKKIIMLCVCYCQPHCEEDMLCVTASLIVKKIQLCTFIIVYIKMNASTAKLILSRGFLYEWDMLAI